MMWSSWCDSRLQRVQGPCPPSQALLDGSDALMDGATLPADGWPPQSHALGDRRVLWPFNRVAVLPPSLSKYGIICFLLKKWIMLWWVLQGSDYRIVFTQQFLLEWRPTLLGTRRRCVLHSLNNNTLTGLFITAMLFEDAGPPRHLFFTWDVIIMCSTLDLGSF